MTTKKLDNLISQTEYGLTVTPVYDEGPARTMEGSAITGKNENNDHNDIVDVDSSWYRDHHLLPFCRCGTCPKEPAIL